MDRLILKYKFLDSVMRRKVKERIEGCTKKRKVNSKYNIKMLLFSVGKRLWS